MKRTIQLFFLTVAICLSVNFFSISDAHAANLKTKVQDELEANPFLKKNGIGLRVIDEANGYITIEFYQGNRQLRERILDGVDIMSGQIEQLMFWGSSSKEERENVKIIRSTLDYIKSMDGVKQVLLVAANNSAEDVLEDLPKLPKWISQLYHNPIEPGVGLAGLKIGDHEKVIIERLGAPKDGTIPVSPSGEIIYYAMMYKHKGLFLGLYLHKDKRTLFSLRVYDSEFNRNGYIPNLRGVSIGSEKSYMIKEFGTPIRESDVADGRYYRYSGIEFQDRKDKIYMIDINRKQ
jgi:hypothetical protein